MQIKEASALHCGAADLSSCQIIIYSKNLGSELKIMLYELPSALADEKIALIADLSVGLLSEKLSKSFCAAPMPKCIRQNKNRAGGFRRMIKFSFPTEAANLPLK